MGKLIKIFTAGKYPQGNVSEADLQEIARNYSVNYFKAPLTRDHQQEGKSLGWVNSVKAIGKDLYCSFMDVAEEALNLTKSGAYKYPSIEIANYPEAGGKYLRAVSLVLFPAVKALPDIAFKDGESSIYFNETISINLFSELNQNNIMDVKILKFGETLGLTGEFSEMDVFAKAEAKFTELTAENAGLKAQDETQKTEIARYKELELSSLVDKAIADKKILPGQRESMLKYAQTDKEGFIAFADKLPVLSIFDSNKVKDKTGKIPGGDARLYKEDGTLLKYQDILDNPNFIKERGLSDEDINSIKEADKRFIGKK